MADKLAALLQWQDPRTTGLVFASLNMTFFLLTCGHYTLVSLLASLLLYFTVGLLLYSCMRPAESSADDYEFISRETVEDLFVAAHEAVSCVMGPKQSFEEFMQTVLAVIVASYLLSCICLMWLTCIAAFTLPLLYAKQKEQLDPLLAQAKEQIAQAKSMASGLIPKSSKAAKSS